MAKPDLTSPPEEIRTSRLILSRSTVGRLSALITGPGEYQRVFGNKVEEGYLDYPDILEYSLQQAQASEETRHWWLLYLMIHREDDALVGICGYKGPPDEDGMVEICYGVAPARSGRGLASEAALALAAHAFSKPGVTGVCAHTLPEPSASTRILTKCGFYHSGELQDTDEGTVWRWELTGLPAASQP